MSSRDSVVYNAFVQFQAAAREYAKFQEETVVAERLLQAWRFRDPNAKRNGGRTWRNQLESGYYSGAYNDTRFDFENEKYEAVIEEGFDKLGGVFWLYCQEEL
jgi:hypothetical protein